MTHLLTRLNLRVPASLVVGLSLLLLVAPRSYAAAYCGSDCNGKMPTSSVDGMLCSSDYKVIAKGNPVGSWTAPGPDLSPTTETQADVQTTVQINYSNLCQTMWAVVINNHSGTPNNCTVHNNRFVATTWSATYSGCPTPTQGYRIYPMVDDHSSSYSSAATISFHEQLYEAVCVMSSASTTECSSTDRELVTFHYQKTY